MPFPESPRVIYAMNPLEEVICQLRFPPILKIEAEPPAAFQDRMRQNFPLYEQPGADLTVPPEIKKVLDAIGLRPGGNGLAHEFSTVDRKWSVTLTKESVALTCRAYERWESFRRYFSLAVQALEEQYSPAFYSRIGLRYRDVIRRSKLGLQNVPWGELLMPPIAAELASDILEQIEQRVCDLLLHLDDHGSKVRVKHGLAVVKDTSEPAYVIDSDFFTEARTENSDVLGILDAFNRDAGRLFRWCITERLHTAMGPKSIPV